MGRQSKTIRNKRKIKVENYQSNYTGNNKIEKKVTKAFTREAQFTIVTVFFIVVVMISGAYAIFSSVQKQKSYNTLTVGTLNVDFDKSSADMGNIINLNGAYPTSDAEGQKNSPYSFEITNSGTLDASYQIKILDDTDMINEDGCNNNLLPKDKIKVSINKETPFLLSSTEANSYIVNGGNLSANESKIFEIRIWIDETAGNEVLGKHYHGKIVVESENSASTTTEANILCKRATELHEEICSSTDTTYNCSADGYTQGSIIKYGSLGTTKLIAGDAFDCDVNGDKTYDASTERFYYVTDMDTNTAVLIYYNNVSGGVANNQAAYAYDASGANNNGPVTAIKQLPTIEQWKNISLTNSTRAITNESGGTTTPAGNLPSAFSYMGYTARLLTYQEVNTTCYDNTTTINSVGSLASKCKFLMENTKYSNSSLKYGYWLETPETSSSDSSWAVTGSGRRLNYDKINNTSNLGVRPAIEVPKSRISY